MIPTEQGQIRFLQAVSGLAHADHNQLLQRLQDNDAQLTSLGLIRRGIGKAGITRLRSALDSNCYLQILDLSFNSIMDDSSEDLATIICNQVSFATIEQSWLVANVCSYPTAMLSVGAFWMVLSRCADRRRWYH